MLAGRNGVSNKGETVRTIRDGALRSYTTTFEQGYSPYSSTNRILKLAVNAQFDTYTGCKAARGYLLFPRLGPVCNKCHQNCLRCCTALGEVHNCTWDKCPQATGELDDRPRFGDHR